MKRDPERTIREAEAWLQRQRQIERAEQRERRAELADALADFHPDAELLDELSTLDVDAAEVRAVLVGGRDALLAHRADAPNRALDRAAEMRLRRKDQLKTHDEAVHWRHAPRAIGRGNPEDRIKAVMRSELIAVGVHRRTLRERLIALASSPGEYVPPVAVVTVD